MALYLIKTDQIDTNHNGIVLNLGDSSLIITGDTSDKSEVSIATQRIIQSNTVNDQPQHQNP